MRRWLCCLLCAWALPVLAAERPNILLLLIDDMGYNDLAINNGNDMPTPTLDRLAQQGIRFTRFYADSTCQPARLALLTGRYPARAGFRPVGRGIPPEWTNLPEALHALGYQTHHVGKWHLGHTPRDAWPTEQGFDTTFGFLNQWMLGYPAVESHFHLSPPHYENPWLTLTDGSSHQFMGHLTDILAAETARLIREADRSKPWFIYHAFFAPHTPAAADVRYLKQFPDTAEGHYRAMIRQLDDAIASMLQALDDTGQADNTIVVIASDNGGPNHARDNNAPFGNGKGTFEEGGLRTFMLWRWPGHAAPQVTDSITTLMDIYPTLLAAIHAPLPEPVDGSNVLNATQRPIALHRDLFWEAGFAAGGDYTVLPAEGSWRYVREHGIGYRLFDPVKDPAGDHNAWWHLLTVADLDGRYWAWRQHTEHSAVRFTAVGDTGQGYVEGDRLQRTPGLSGFSFGIGVTPGDQAGGWQTLAEQAGAFRLQYHPQLGLRGEAAGLSFASPVQLAPGRCHAVMVTGFWFLPSLLWGGEPDSWVGLYVDGQRLARTTGKYHDIDGAIFREPTWIGRQANGAQPFTGHLGSPLFLNTDLVAGVRWMPGGNQLQKYSDTLCQD